MAKEGERETLTIQGRDVVVTNPGKVLFPALGITKLELARYYVSVAEGALRGAGGRPNVLVRYPNGTHGEFFYQKRAPTTRPSWLELATVHFPSGNVAHEVVPRDAAALVWLANLGCLELHPHPVRAEDLDHPDELRIDLDPMPGVPFGQLQEVAEITRTALSTVGLTGFPKTSGSRGIHILVRIEARYSFTQVRRAALALARDVEQRAPRLATSKWWKEERHGVFLDYNQNAKDRTVASAYSVRPTPDARVSAPVSWQELMTCAPEQYTLRTMPARYAELGDLHAALDAQSYSLDALLELSKRHEADGLQDAPWPPHYRKQPTEPTRVNPGRKKRTPREGPARPKAAAPAASQPVPTKAGKRTSKYPLIELARARKKDDALAGLARWKARHAAIVGYLEPSDILIDSMRGRYTTWTRIRVNLQHVPAEQRPPQEPLDPDDAPRWDAKRQP